MSALGVPWKLEKLVKRQAGGLYLPLPVGTVISSDEGKRSWELTEESRRVQGPDGTLTSLLHAKGERSPLVLAHSHRKGRLALVHVSERDYRSIVPPVLDDLSNPLVFLPGDFRPPAANPNVGTHKELVRMLWTAAPEEIRRDLVTEQAERDRLLALPHAQAPALLWLIGGRALEGTLGRLGVVAPGGAAGMVQCMQVEQPALLKGARQLHVVLRATSPGKPQVRLCVPYLPGGARFGEVGLEFRELPGSTAGAACPLTSSLALFSQRPAQFAVKRLIFSFPPVEGGGTGEGWQLLKAPNVPQDDVLRAIWAALPEKLRRGASSLAKGPEELAEAARKLATGLGSALKNGSVQGDKANIVAKEAIARWEQCSAFARLESGLVASKEGGLTLKGCLLRSFRTYASRLAAMQNGLSEPELQEILEQLSRLSPIG